MATDFGGLQCDRLKTIVTLKCLHPEGVSILEGLELDSRLVRKLEPGEEAVFASETFKALDGSIRIRLLDGTGFASIFSADGTTFLAPPNMPAVESSTDVPFVNHIVIRLTNHRFFAAYLSTLTRLGFKADTTAVSVPGIYSFRYPEASGIERAKVDEAFEQIVNTHIARYFVFPCPQNHRSDEWFRYEMWMEYKREISVFAD